MNMKNWLAQRMAETKRKPLPLLSFPSIQLLGLTVKELISDGDAQARGMYAIAKRCDAAAAVSMMDLSVEAECFGAQIMTFDHEVPTVTGMLVAAEEDAVALLARAGSSREYGARPLRRAVSALVEDPAADLMLSGRLKQGDTLRVVAEDGEIRVRPE